MSALDAPAPPAAAEPAAPAGPGAPGDTIVTDTGAARTDGEATTRAWRRRLTELDGRLGEPGLPLALTLILVLLATEGSWPVRVPVVVLGTLGVAVPGVRRASGFWLALAAVLGAAAWADRWAIDNHQFLIAYWCLTVGLAAASPDPARVRRIGARLLVGAVFLLAVTWKVLSPDFVDGSFMRHTLLTDARFGEVAELVGGLTPADLDANRAALASFDDPAADLGPVELRTTDALDRAADVVTWWTLGIEGAVAITFLVPWRRLARHRDAALIAFVVTTYAIAPVVGFGWVLVCLGLAQREPGRRLVPLAYLGAFLLVQAFTAPWTSLAGTGL
jgi:hypothetical protein